MASSGRQRDTPAPSGHDGVDRPSGYFASSKHPVTIAVVVLPLVLLYEIGSLVALRNPQTHEIETVSAHQQIVNFFAAFGVFGLYLPALAVVAVLLVLAVLAPKAPRFKPIVFPAMVIEAAAWTGPLLLAALLLLPGISPSPATVVGDGSTTAVLDAMPWLGRLTISIGAGVYEEFVFRLVGLTLLHLLFVDLLRLKEKAAWPIAIGLTALAFAFYHDLSTAGGEFDLGRLALYTFAGTYFGVLFALRGFAIPVLVHTMYNIVVLVVLRS